jgi:hypothetical protein
VRYISCPSMQSVVLKKLHLYLAIHPKLSR